MSLLSTSIPSIQLAFVEAGEATHTHTDTIQHGGSSTHQHNVINRHQSMTGTKRSISAMPSAEDNTEESIISVLFKLAPLLY
jgi:hypothetical protein